MNFGIISYLILIGLGYLLLLNIDKTEYSNMERILHAFFLGCVNVTVVIIVFGLFYKLSVVNYFLLLEMIVLMFLLLMGKKNINSLTGYLNLNEYLFDMFIVLLISVGVFLRFYYISTYIPAVSWDALKIYFPWARELFLSNKIPNFDFTFNGATPIGHSISFVGFIYFIYSWAGRIDEVLAYSISPIFSVMNILAIYLFIRKFYGKRNGLIAALLLSFTPWGIIFGAMPYTESMLSFFITCFFFFIARSKLIYASLALSLSVLTKYSGFLLLFILIFYLYRNRSVLNLRKIIGIILGLSSILLWYFRNFLIYSNPLPFMAFTVKTFEKPPQSFEVLTEVGTRVGYLTSFPFVKTFFVDSIFSLSHWIFVIYTLCLIYKRKNLRFFTISVLLILLLTTLSGENGLRYLVPFSSICVLIFIDMLDNLSRFAKKAYGKMVALSIISIVFLAFYLEKNLFVNLPSHISPTTYMYLIPLGVISVLFVAYHLLVVEINQYVRRRFQVNFKINNYLKFNLRSPFLRIRMKRKVVVAVFLVCFLILNFYSNSKSPIGLITYQVPDWQYDIIDVIEFTKKIEYEKSIFLMVEDPGLRYYAQVNLYELTDTYGAIHLSDLYDDPSIKGVFFGFETHHLATQNNDVIGFTNYNKYEALIQNKLDLVYSNLSCQQYYLLISYLGSARLFYSDPTKNTNDTISMESINWKTLILEIYASEELHLSIQRTNYLNDLHIRSILIAPIGIFNEKYIENLRNILAEKEISHIIMSDRLVNVWIYYYCSIFTYIYLDGDSSLFNRIYESENWSIYEVVY